MKRGDWAIAIVGIVVAMALYFGYDLLQNHSAENYVVIKSEGTVVKTFPLDEDTDEIYHFKNDYGSNLIVIERGVVDVIEADCKNQICVNSASISEVGQSIICLPHRLSVEIVGGTAEDVDVIAY